MAWFVARIELHENPRTPTAEDYKRVHKAMKSIGFSRFIQMGDKWKHMPNSTYRLTSDKNDRTLSDEVRAAVGKEWSTFGSLVGPMDAPKTWLAGLKDATKEEMAAD